jgi:hypothetical protein
VSVSRSPGGGEPPLVDHAAPEGGLVELDAEDRLMDILQLTQREERGQEGEADIRIIQLAAQPQHSERQDIGMIEGERQRLPARAHRPDRPTRFTRPRHLDRRGDQRRHAQ